MKITHLPEAAAPRISKELQRAGSFEAHFAEMQTNRVTGNTPPAGRFDPPDFTNMTKSEYVAWGMSEFVHGESRSMICFRFRSLAGISMGVFPPIRESTTSWRLSRAWA